MSLRLIASILAALAGALALSLPAASQETSAPAVEIELSGTIDPATEAWIGRALDDAAEDGAPLAIIRIDTPGGLDSSMREIVKDIIEAPMPVVVWVAPDGARAASAGLFITQAADVAAMAPQTNIGSASPISATGEDLGDVLGEKVTNDAAAFVRALATEHGRNPALAEEMVREATNVTAEEALEADLIDLIAADRTALLAELDGFAVVGPKAGILDTEGLEVTEREMPLQFELLQILVNPNVAFLLLIAGLLGLAIEAFAPGGIVPGALGAVSLLLGLFGVAQLPVTVVGIALLLLGVGLLIAETQVPTGGLLGIAGVLALGGGGLLLFDTDSESFEISPVLVIVVVLLLGGGLAFVVQRVASARRNPPLAGHEELVGMKGVVRVPLDPIGQIFVAGALWRARLEGDPDEPIPAGYRVRVESVDGLTLTVSPLPESLAGGKPSDSKGAE